MIDGGWEGGQTETFPEALRLLADELEGGRGAEVFDCQAGKVMSHGKYNEGAASYSTFAW